MTVAVFVLAVFYCFNNLSTYPSMGLVLFMSVNDIHNKM